MTTQKKGNTMTEIINFLARAMEQALAQGLSAPDARRVAEVAVRVEFAGERVYVAALPKQRRAVQLAKLEGRTTQQIVATTGMSRQHVWRLRKLGR